MGISIHICFEKRKKEKSFLLRDIHSCSPESLPSSRTPFMLTRWPVNLQSSFLFLFLPQEHLCTPLEAALWCSWLPRAFTRYVLSGRGCAGTKSPGIESLFLPDLLHGVGPFLNLRASIAPYISKGRNKPYQRGVLWGFKEICTEFLANRKYSVNGICCYLKNCFGWCLCSSIPRTGPGWGLITIPRLEMLRRIGFSTWGLNFLQISMSSTNLHSFLLGSNN